MKRFLLNVTLTIASIAMMGALAYAHDPAEHAQSSEAPDCKSIEHMDHGNMDMNDPVTRAMMQKCGELHQPTDKTMDDMDHNDKEPGKTTPAESHGAYAPH